MTRVVNAQAGYFIPKEELEALEAAEEQATMQVKRLEKKLAGAYGEIAEARKALEFIEGVMMGQDCECDASVDLTCDRCKTYITAIRILHAPGPAANRVIEILAAWEAVEKAFGDTLKLSPEKAAEKWNAMKAVESAAEEYQEICICSECYPKEEDEWKGLCGTEECKAQKLKKALEAAWEERADEPTEM